MPSRPDVMAEGGAPEEDLDFLRGVASKEFKGLQEADEIASRNYRVRGKWESENATTIEWIFHGRHGSAHPGAQEADETDEMEDFLSRRDFLGYTETGEDVYIFACTVNIATPEFKGVHTYWDRYLALRQIGVRTTGRPVLAPWPPPPPAPVLPSA